MSPTVITVSDAFSANKKGVRAALVCCSVVAFVLGFAAAQTVGPWLHGTPGLRQDSTAIEGASAFETRIHADTVARFKAIDWAAQAPVGTNELIAALPIDTALRTIALERYRSESAGLSKDNLRQLLSAQLLPEVYSAALNWAQQADSAQARVDGFLLLASMPAQQSTYALAREALKSEHDSAALAAAVWAAMPLGIPDPTEVRQVVPRLHALTRHSVADVRAASIQRLAGWDRSRRFVIQDVLHLLSDMDSQVRVAALGASSIAALTSDAVKQRLFAMLSNEREDVELRSIAALQLDRFALNHREYKLYQSVQRDLLDKAKIR